MPKLKIKSSHKKKLNECLTHFHSYVIPPLRCTMIQMHRCYVCDTMSLSKEHSLQIYLKSYERRNLVGYIACDKCKSIVPLLLDLYEETGDYIPNSIYDGYNITNSNIRFFRKSKSRSDIKPYIETKASIDINGYPVFHKTSDNRLHVLVFWTTLITNLYGSDTITKTITMANLIHHNRDIFGYELSEGPYRKCAAIWEKDIKTEYAIANEYIELSNTLDNISHLDGLVKTLIYDYWRSSLI